MDDFRLWVRLGTGLRVGGTADRRTTEGAEGARQRGRLRERPWEVRPEGEAKISTRSSSEADGAWRVREQRISRACGPGARGRVPKGLLWALYLGSWCRRFEHDSGRGWLPFLRDLVGLLYCNIERGLVWRGGPYWKKTGHELTVTEPAEPADRPVMRAPCPSSLVTCSLQTSQR